MNLFSSQLSHLEPKLISTHFIKTISEERAELKVKGPQSENDK
jgi:hypothetical protein